MAIVSERMNPKPAQQPMDPRNPMSSRSSSGVQSLVNPLSNLTTNESENSGFFTSFFPSKTKKKPGVLEPPPPVLKASGNLSEREIMEMEVIKLLIQSYYNIVKRTVCDLVPKSIMYTLVNRSKEELQRELLTELYGNKDLVEDSMKESEFVQTRRAECKKMIEALKAADEITSQV